MKEAMRMDEILFWNEANDDDSFSIKMIIILINNEYI